MKILFNEEKHIYYLEGTDKTFTSVSKVLDTIKNKFDVDKQAQKYSEKSREDILKGLAKSNGLTLEQARKKWNTLELNADDIKNIWQQKNTRITERGTIYHALKEKELINDGSFIHKMSNSEKEAFDLQRLKNLEPGIYPELIIPYLPTWVIGTADYIKINPDKTFFIRDYKCNDDLEIEPKKYYKKEKGYSDYEYFKVPVSHIPSTKFNGYQLQLSLYSYFLEHLGYKFIGGVIEHIMFDKNDKPSGDVKEYPITYMKKEVEAILKYFKLNNK